MSNKTFIKKTVSLIMVKSCNTFLCMLLLCIPSYLKSVIIFWSQKGSVSKKIWETLPQTIHNWSSIQWVTKELLFPYGPDWTHLHLNRITNYSLKSCLHYYFQTARSSNSSFSKRNCTQSDIRYNVSICITLSPINIIKKNCTFIFMGHTRSCKNK